MFRNIYKCTRCNFQSVGIFMSLILLFAQASAAFPPPRVIVSPVYRPRPIPRVLAPVPPGRVVSVLPVGYVALMVAGVLYYSHAGIYYRKASSGYVVVAAPNGEGSTQQVSTSDNVKVITKVLNVRTGPGVENSIVFQVYANMLLQVIGNAEGWLYVQLPDGNKGWVMAKFTMSLKPHADG